MNNKVKRALISVFDKTDLVGLAQQLNKLGIEILSTGGTFRDIKKAGVQAIEVSKFTGSPEIMKGRVKTLHPKVFAGILHRRDVKSDTDEMLKAGYGDGNINFVIVNLYPFQQTIAKHGVTEEEAVENIDIGGPSMVRAAAKNFQWVCIIVDPADYPLLIAELEANNGQTTLEFRRKMAAKAFTHTYNYDAAIAGYFTHGIPDADNPFPPNLFVPLSFKVRLRYGENPHQKAALYTEPSYPFTSLTNAEILSGKELSFNNYWDLVAAIQMILDFDEPFATVIKHTNPCGAAVGNTLAEAYGKALACDPLSAFGSVIGLNHVVDLDTARLLHQTQFIECIIAPDFEPDALELLKKKKQRRLLAVGDLKRPPFNYLEMRPIPGGALAQTRDTKEVTADDLKTVTKVEPTPEQIKDLLFGFKMVKHIKSNAILIAKGGATLGIGAGQTSRVDSSIIAVRKAGDRANGAVAASDAFFPMPDGLETLTDAGVKAVIQPGGSKGDPEAIAAADKAGIAMVFTGFRHFKH